MLTTALRAARRLHPLHHMRKVPLFRAVTRNLKIDVPVKTGSGVRHTLYVDLFRNMTFALGGIEIVEEREQESLTRLIGLIRPARFFDVGANVGTYISAVLQSAPDADVVAFEPDARNLGLLRRSVARNGWTRVTIHPFAASSEVGEISFYADDVTGATGSITEGAEGTFGNRHYKAAPRKITLAATTIDAAAQQFGAPDLVKIDVEGAELAVFAGARGTLAATRPAVVFECSADAGAIAAVLTSAGYTLFDFATRRPIDLPSHNTLALHAERHAEAIAGF